MTYKNDSEWRLVYQLLNPSIFYHTYVSIYKYIAIIIIYITFSNTNNTIGTSTKWAIA